jgi:hypothetical protein
MYLNVILNLFSLLVFHFEVGRANMEPTDRNIIKKIDKEIMNRQVRYLATQKGRERLWPKRELRVNVTHVMNALEKRLFAYYDFMGVVERFWESLAVMSLLWDLPPSDFIVLSAKRSGGFDDGGHESTCTKIPKAFVSPVVKEYLEGVYQYSNADFLLYDVAQQSLDRTIEYLGREKVNAVVTEMQRLQKIADDKCQDEAKFPCSDEGILQLEVAEESCFVQDAGCGHVCVERVLRNEHS